MRSLYTPFFLLSSSIAGVKSRPSTLAMSGFIFTNSTPPRPVPQPASNTRRATCCEKRWRWRWRWRWGWRWYLSRWKLLHQLTPEDGGKCFRSNVAIVLANISVIVLGPHIIDFLHLHGITFVLVDFIKVKVVILHEIFSLQSPSLSQRPSSYHSLLTAASLPSSAFVDAAGLDDVFMDNTLTNTVVETINSIISFIVEFIFVEREG